MIEYWRNPEATAKKYAGEFLLTGDLGGQDDDGYFWYMSREDDVITSAGYRIGPSEIEDTLMKHPAVALVRGGRHSRSDPHRGGEGMDRAAAGFCGQRSAGARDPGIRQGASSPRTNIRGMVQFAESLPMTATGKVLRRELRTLG